MSNDGRSSSRTAHFWAVARVHASTAFAGGLVLVLTGFTPEHWVAYAFHAFHLPEGLFSRWPSGLDPRLMRRLRRGDFAWQAYIDLHGMTTEEARPAVDRFLIEAVRVGHRCVLIVHGRGHNSKDQTPVLKERLKVWLARGSAARIVLAFATARPSDGGAGALYVLLRRDRRKRPIRVTEGAAS